MQKEATVTDDFSDETKVTVGPSGETYGKKWPPCPACASQGPFETALVFNKTSAIGPTTLDQRDKRPLGASVTCSCGHRRDVPFPECCPDCGSTVFEVSDIEFPPGMPDPNERRCACGGRWATPEFLAWAKKSDEQRAEAAKRAVAFAGADPLVVDCPGQGQLFFASPSKLRAPIPNVSVLLLPGRRCLVTTEQNVTRRMRQSMETAAADFAATMPGNAAWDDHAIKVMFARVIRWLRTKVTVGVLYRLPDGAWDMRGPLS